MGRILRSRHAHKNRTIVFLSSSVTKPVRYLLFSHRGGPCNGVQIDLSGRVALVTGASSGLGAQFARTLAGAGAAVVLAGRRVERLKDLRAEIEADGGDAHVVKLDVTDIDSIRAAVAHAETEMGTIDILVNNSGVSTTQRWST
jgi:NADP-dependent 3-hydroxy acid dehydrogenase YdfG